MKTRGILKPMHPSAWCLLLVTACGSTEFQGNGSGVKESSPPPPTDVNKQPTPSVASLTWYWQCATDPGTPPLGNGQNIVMSEGGAQQIAKSAVSAEVPLTMAGKVCPPAKYPRDIIFVIDVSGSMATSPGNDVKTGSAAAGYTCGRLQAVDAIIANVVAQGGDSRFGIVTFSDNIVKSSSTIFADRESLYNDIAPNAKPDTVLCDGLAGTKYSKGLLGAQTLLQNSRPDALKEIYFVSDGIPDAMDKLPSEALARTLKSEGVLVQGEKTPVQLATVMLGSSNADVLKTMASVNSDGKQLHANATDASKLAATLSGLAANEIVDGSIRYRATGSPDWIALALKPYLETYEFAMPPFQISPKDAPNGLEFEFEYYDQHNNKFSQEGSISWGSSSK